MPRLSQLSPKSFRDYFSVKNGDARWRWQMLSWAMFIFSLIISGIGLAASSLANPYDTLALLFGGFTPLVTFSAIPSLTLMAIVHLTVFFHTRENHYRPQVAITTLVLATLAMLATYAIVFGLVYAAAMPIIGLIPLLEAGMGLLPATSLIASTMAVGVTLATTLLSLTGAELQRVLMPWLRSRLPFRAMHQRQPAPSHEFSDTQSLAPTAALAHYGAIATATGEQPATAATTTQAQNPPAGRNTNPSPLATPATIATSTTSATPLLVR